MSSRCLRPRPRRITHPAVALAALLLVAPISACSGSDGTAPAVAASSTAAPALLSQARSTLDAAKSVRFRLNSSNVPTDGTRLIDGTGVMSRPTPTSGAFDGTVSVVLNGSKVTVALISLKDTVYVKLPFSTTYQVTDPAAFGLSDPAALISTKTGISQLFGALSGVTDEGEQRIGTDVVRTFSGTVPGTLVDSLLTSADPKQPVAVKLSVVPGSGQLRQAELTGPFFAAGADSTYTLQLDRYDEKVTISAPPVATPSAG